MNACNCPGCPGRGVGDPAADSVEREVAAYVAPAVTPLGHPRDMPTVQLVLHAANLVAPFAWGKPVADELRLRAERMKFGLAADAMTMFVDPVRR